MDTTPRKDEQGSKGPNGAVNIPPGEKVPPIFDPFAPEAYKKFEDPRIAKKGDPSERVLPSSVTPTKPKRSWFFRCHPTLRGTYTLITDENAKRPSEATYLFSADLQIPPDLEDIVRPTMLAAAVTNSGVYFLYKLPVSDSGWYDSGLEVIDRATQEWIRVSPGNDGYTIRAAKATFPDPIFPDVPLRDWMERAFKKRIIRSLDHPLIAQLRTKEEE